MGTMYAANGDAFHCHHPETDDSECHCYDEMEHFVYRGGGTVEDFGPIEFDPNCPLHFGGERSGLVHLDAVGRPTELSV